MEESLISKTDKLTVKSLERFSMSYREAKRLGIVDEDLVYISEIGPNKFRISIPAFDKRRTAVAHTLIDAIKKKYEMLEQIEKDRKVFEEKTEILKEARGKITKYSLVRDGILLYFKDRKKDNGRTLIQITTFENDIVDFENSKYLNDFGIFDKPIYLVDSEYAQSLVDYLRGLKVLQGKNKGKPLEENTIYKPFSFIHKVFNYFCDDLEIIDKNPFSKVKNKPHSVSNDKEYLIDKEMHLLKDMLEFENIRFKTLITLIMDTGMRREEALALKFSDINKFRGTICIERAFVKSRLDNRLIIKPTKRKKSEREIVCTAYALELIDKWKKFKEACGFIVNDDDYIFTAWDSMELIDPETFSREFKKFIKKIGITKNIPLKNLRTTHITFFVARNSNIKAVQNRAGHEDINTTLGIYAQSNLNEDKKLVNEYEEEFYNKLGLSMPDLYRIISGRYENNRKLFNVLEEVCNEYIDETNYDIQFRRFKEYVLDLFPILNKILIIDSFLEDEEIDSIFKGFSYLYRSIKIEPLEPQIRI